MATHKIGFITASVISGHAVRGIGFYTRNLLTALQEESSKYNMQIIEVRDTQNMYAQNFDLLHYPFFDLFSPTLPLKKPIPTIVTVHDAVPLDYPSVYQVGLKARLALNHQKLSLKNASSIITDSYASVNSIKKYLSVPDEKIKLVYLAASDNYHKVSSKSKLINIAKKYSLPKKFVLFVGDINYNKNLNLLLSACIQANLNLVLVGKNLSQITQIDTSHPELHHLEETKKLIKNKLVHVLGFVPDEELVCIYNLATVYCQPSLNEGFGIPILEAAACGAAVVTSNIPVFNEILGPDFQKFQFSPSDINQASVCLENIFNSSKDRTENISILSKRTPLFSWSKAATETLLVYQQILCSKK